MRKALLKVAFLFMLGALAFTSAFVIHALGVWGQYALMAIFIALAFAIVLGYGPKGDVSRIAIGFSLAYIGVTIVLNAWSHVGSLEETVSGLFGRDLRGHSSEVLAGTVFFAGGLVYALLYMSNIIDFLVDDRQT